MLKVWMVSENTRIFWEEKFTAGIKKKINSSVLTISATPQEPFFPTGKFYL